MAGSNPSFMSGVPVLLILQLLDAQEMYGYELVKAIRIATGDTISLGEGVVYPVLHSLERSGAVKAKRKDVNGRTRVYYQIKAKGQRRLARLTERWSRIRDGVENALGNPPASLNRV